jgi:hypothetical protein
MRMSDGHAARTRLRYDYITIGPAEAYVAPSGAHVAPSLTWSQAARDIQSAVDTAVDGTVIYVSNELFRVTNEIVLAKGVRVKSVDAGMAVLDGGLPGRTGRCVYVSHADARVEGFVIQCSGYPYYGSTGGAVLVWMGAAASSAAYWRAMWAGFGAAIYTYRGGQILDCVISNSYTPGYGIGSAFCDGNAQIRNSLFVDNRTYNAGGLYAIGSLVSNCLFVGNVARGIYGGLARHVRLWRPVAGAAVSDQQ